LKGAGQIFNLPRTDDFSRRGKVPSHLRAKVVSTVAFQNKIKNLSCTRFEQMQYIINLYKLSFSDLSRSVWLLSIVMLINRSGTMVIPFLGVFLTQEEGFSIVQTGYIMSFIGIGSVLGTYIGGRITDATGHYGVQFWSLMLSGIGFLFMPFVDSFWTWCAVIFVVIAISDAFRPANQAAIGFYSKPENRTRSMSLVRLAINLGFSAGPVVGGIVAVAFGYNWLFVLDGLTCIGAALMFWYLLPNDKKIARNKETTNDTSMPDIAISSVQSPYRDTYFILFVICNMCMAIAFVQFMMALPIYFKETLLLPENWIGILLGINGFVIAIIEMPFVYEYEKRQYKKLPTIALGTALIGLCYLILPTTDFVGIAVLSMMLLTIGEIISFPFSATYALNRAVPENRGAYMGLFGISWSGALILSPLLTSWLIDNYGYNITWLTIGTLPILGSLGMYYLHRREQVMSEF